MSVRDYSYLLASTRINSYLLVSQSCQVVSNGTRQSVTDRGRSQHISTERGVCLVQGWSRLPRFGSTIRCDLSRFVTIQYDLMRWSRLKINRVDRRKCLNRPKNVYDQHDYHDWPQDLIMPQSHYLLENHFQTSSIERASHTSKMMPSCARSFALDADVATQWCGPSHAVVSCSPYGSVWSHEVMMIMLKNMMQVASCSAAYAKTQDASWTNHVVVSGISVTIV